MAQVCRRIPARARNCTRTKVCSRQKGTASRTLLTMGFDPSVKFLRPSRLPKELSKERQQVAAVCYRMGKRGIEFLLVETRGGLWIFPKGGVERGLTHAQSAALEALEEAGVHGRMEQIPFARYFRRKPDSATDGGAAQLEHAVTTYLCEV